MTDYKKLIPLFALTMLFAMRTGLYSQSSGFDQFMGINLRVNEPSLGKAQCVSHAREFHNWVIDQGKRIQDPASRREVRFVIKPDSPVDSLYELYALTDTNFDTILATLDTFSSVYDTNGVEFNIYRFNEFQYVYDNPLPPHTLLYKHIRIFYNLTENCFNMVDDNNDGLIDCQDTLVCNCGSSSADFPYQQFKWNPPYQSQAEVHYDFFYDQLQGLGLTISPSMTGSLPHLALVDAGDGDFMTRKPIQWTGNTNNPGEGESTDEPSSYLERADWIFQYLARYGSGSPIDTNDLKLHPSETKVINRGNISYIESWNEPDKYWWGAEAQFNAQEYAAMASCDYDGHEGLVDIDSLGVDHNYGLGVDQFGIHLSWAHPINWTGTGWMA